MGVTGLWRLIEPAGKPVPIETLENKVLAVDISIWLHQMVKGYQDAKGAPLPNAHLMGLFQRLCKLLYFRIKPVFVFDGGVPDLKWQTIAKRQDNKLKYNSESERLKRELALLLGKKTAIGALLGKQISPKKANTPQNDDDLFKLPALPQNDEETDTESEDDETSSSASTVDLHTVDLESEDFKKMPVKEKYDLLIELKETRKMNSWGKLHTLPKKSDNFSDFQMQRLLKRRKVQECIEDTEKEMGDIGMSFKELESLLNEEGIDTKLEELPTRRIASDQTTRFLLINNVKQSLAEAKKLKEQKAINELKTSDIPTENTDAEEKEKSDEVEDDLQRAIKMSLECMDEPTASTSTSTSKQDESWTSFLTDSEHSDDEMDDFAPPAISSAKAYIMQYSDFTHKAIDGIVTSTSISKAKIKEPTVSQIIEELNEQPSVIVSEVDLNSDEESVKTAPKETFEASVENVALCHEAIKNTKEVITVGENNASILCVEATNLSVINLDSTTEDLPTIENDSVDDSNKISSSSDDEFEDVSESENKLSKPIVELTLNLNQLVEDDIFADVFEEKKPITSMSPASAPILYNDMSTKETKDLLEITSTSKIDNKADKREEEKTDYKEITVKESSKKVTKDLLESVSTSQNDEKSDKCEEEKTDFKEKTIKEPRKILSDQTTLNKTDTIDDKKDEEPNKEVHKTETAATSLTDTGPEILKSNQKIDETRREPIKPSISKEMLQSMETEVDKEQETLQQEKGRLDRIGRNISEQMTKEAQELLQVFGIPYIVAPMEAEAQCAFLETANLTDGTITDDSDIWLFGGKTVYKNFFNQKKLVLQFISERIEKSFNLTREQLVLLALLVGSDYTTGVSGVGPVTALEILASFPFNKKKVQNETSKQAQYQEIITGLQEFKQWVRAGRRTDNVTLKKKLKNVKLTDDFPSVRVVQAYLEPNVETSKEKFLWGEIDITILRDYTKSKFGWSQNKLDEMINPVLKRLVDRKSQKTVHDYFKRKTEFQSVDDQVSKRVKAAIMKMNPNAANQTNEDGETQTETSTVVKSAKAVTKRKLKDEEVHNISKVVKVATVANSNFDIIIPKTDKCQEFIPQREKVKQNLLENKLKAIEVFRKTKIDRKRKFTKKKAIIPKDKADLSESSDSE